MVTARTRKEPDRLLLHEMFVDFERLRRSPTASGHHVPALIYTDDVSFPRGRDFAGRIAIALAAAADHLVDSYGGVLWLSPPARS